MQTVSDEQLWNAASHDDERAFNALYQRYWLKLYRTFCYYLQDKQQAEQALQDVFVVLWRRRKALKIDSFKNYIFISARYRVFKLLKARKVDIVQYVEQLGEGYGETVDNEVYQKVEQEDFEQQLGVALQDLPKRCREIFWMSRVEHRSNDEIAENLGISKRTVENQLTHALKQLRLVYGKVLTELLVVVFYLWLRG
ncbi:RNA polymerase sigma-70 factor [Olivibacter ginsenosidimutans]|uniref:RNA polymerase sigma factor n=1 Tax=Olivibacter ginsenosidimutans TaxID=1176537 RepID=UPI0031EB0DD7